MEEHLFLALGMPGQWEWLVVAFLALLIFGRRLPEVARGLGKSITEFKKGLHEAKDSTDELVDNVRQTKDDVVSDAKKGGLDEAGTVWKDVKS